MKTEEITSFVLTATWENTGSGDDGLKTNTENSRIVKITLIPGIGITASNLSFGEDASP